MKTHKRVQFLYLSKVMILLPCIMISNFGKLSEGRKAYILHLHWLKWGINIGLNS